MHITYTNWIFVKYMYYILLNFTVLFQLLKICFIFILKSSIQKW